MKVGVVSALVLVAGCDSLFGLTHVRDTDAIDAATSDARDAAPPTGDASSDAVDAFVDIGCPIDYGTAPSGKKYKYVPMAKTWLAAQNACLADTPAGNSMHTHLAVSSSDAETTSIIVDAAASAGDVWVGLSDQVSNGSFKWVTDEPVSYPPASGTPWAAGAPSNATGEDCVVERAQQREFDDVSCAGPFTYVCECDAFVDTGAPNY